jgi:KaiC/GvpD/RAD55 family RecA-like ATPase
MLKEELIAKSPVRLLEKSIEGGLKAGNIGVIASRKGIGKTSVLVQIALDKLLQGEKVIHVSFTAHTSYVISWYENIFGELAKRKNLEKLGEIKDNLVKDRVIMNFAQEAVTIDQILRSLKAMMKEGGFKASTLIVDGYDFSKASGDRLTKVKAFAEEMGLEVWYSATLAGDEPQLDKNNVPTLLKDYVDSISVLILLEPKAEYIHFTVVKDHGRMNPQDLKLKLDAKTLLIAET